MAWHGMAQTLVDSYGLWPTSSWLLHRFKANYARCSDGIGSWRVHAAWQTLSIVMAQAQAVLWVDGPSPGPGYSCGLQPGLVPAPCGHAAWPGPLTWMQFQVGLAASKLKVGMFQDQCA